MYLHEVVLDHIADDPVPAKVITGFGNASVRTVTVTQRFFKTRGRCGSFRNRGVRAVLRTAAKRGEAFPFAPAPLPSLFRNLRSKN